MHCAVVNVWCIFIMQAYLAFLIWALLLFCWVRFTLECSQRDLAMWMANSCRQQEKAAEEWFSNTLGSVLPIWRIKSAVWFFSLSLKEYPQILNSHEQYFGLIFLNVFIWLNVDWVSPFKFGILLPLELCVLMLQIALTFKSKISN